MVVGFSLALDAPTPPKRSRGGVGAGSGVEASAGRDQLGTGLRSARVSPIACAL